MQEIKTIKNKEAKALLLSVALVLFVGFLFPPATTEAGPLLTPFGGKITTMVPCTCSSGYQLTIAIPYKYAGTYLYLPGVTKLYKQNMVIPGSYILGKYNPAGACLVTATPCVALPITKGTINFIGTSFP